MKRQEILLKKFFDDFYELIVASISDDAAAAADAANYQSSFISKRTSELRELLGLILIDPVAAVKLVNEAADLWLILTKFAFKIYLLKLENFCLLNDHLTTELLNRSMRLIGRLKYSIVCGEKISSDSSSSSSSITGEFVSYLEFIDRKCLKNLKNLSLSLRSRQQQASKLRRFVDKYNLETRAKTVVFFLIKQLLVYLSYFVLIYFLMIYTS
jgi:hypothetical protein